MSQITSFGRPECVALSKAMIAELEKLGAKYGVQFKTVGGAINSDTCFTAKIECAILNAKTGKAETKIAQDFKRYSTTYGVPAKFLNKKFISRGKEFKLTGLKMTSRLYPFVAELADGTAYKFSAETVRIALGI